MALEKIFKDFIHFAQCNELKIEGIAIADTDILQGDEEEFLWLLKRFLKILYILPSVMN